jgi:hypothetical protein
MEQEGYDLDVTGTYFAALQTRGWKPMHRLTAVLRQPVEPLILSAALEETMRRFPYYSVSLEKHFFAYRLVHRPLSFHPADDGGVPFDPARHGDALLCLCYHGRTVSLEMRHTLADGHGAMVFMKTLLVCYFRLLGTDVPQCPDIPDINEAPDPAEFEDAYSRFRARGAGRLPREGPAYRLPGHAVGSNNRYAVTGVVSTRQVRDKARERGANVTEYLAAALAQALVFQQHVQPNGRPRPVRIGVTADLRRIYKTPSMRNFVVSFNAAVEADSPSLAPALERVRSQCRACLTPRSLTALMNSEAGYSDLFIVRAAPLWLKNLIIVIAQRFIGESRHTINFSNLGAVELPEALAPHIERFEATGNNLRTIKLECGVISFQNKLSICFSCAQDSSEPLKRFFGLLEEDGIRAELSGNLPAMITEGGCSSGFGMIQ